MKKGALDLTLKSLFAIFIVLFVLFLSFSIFSARKTSLEIENEFDSQRSEQALFMSILGSSCISVDSYGAKDRQVATQSLMSFGKLEAMHNGNEDLRCAENFEYIYSIRVQDIENKKEWKIGVLENNAYGRSRTLALPGTIIYDFKNVSPPTIHTARVFMTRYDGPMPTFYGKIKEVCRTKNSVPISLNLDNDISYKNSSNALKYGQAQFFVYFGCKVNDFSLKKGGRLAIVRYKDNGVVIV